MKKPISNKKQLSQFKETLKQRLMSGEEIISLISSLNQHIEAIIVKHWRQHIIPSANQPISLIALGSLARNELQPYSDVDLLLLTQSPDQYQTQIANFIQALWDSGLQVGHQVTDIAHCIALADTELTVISSLMDMRLIEGCAKQFDELRYKLSPTQTWPSKQFFNAKWQEQSKRHKKFDATAYNLEPDIKQGPGGLRDLQMIIWIAHRHYGEQNLAQLFSSQLINDKEYKSLLSCQLYLWRVRFALHLLAGQAQERLVFSYQKNLADCFSFKDKKDELAIEQFMKQFYQHIKIVRELNELLLQLFRERIFKTASIDQQFISHSFFIRNGYLDITEPNAFKKVPRRLLTSFILSYTRSDIIGLSGNSMRLIRNNNYLVDSNFRKDSKINKLFIKILNTPENIYELLRSLHRFGILNRYIPEFANVSGQMQYDLFHVYTVDQHSLFVIKNVADFFNKEKSDLLTYELIQTIAPYYPLFIAALFHDIGKGQGGDHSLIGEKIALRFCQRHKIARAETDIICFLVKHHLLMSHTAQRKDIDDPNVIQQFCDVVQSQNYLNHLYLLTIADIKATNPAIWNSWKASLLKQLYFKAKKQFSITNNSDEASLVQQVKQDALLLLQPIKKELILALWSNIKNSYFLQFPANIIATHTRAILQSQTFPLILIHPHHTGCGSQIIIYMQQCPSRFAITTTIISNSQLSIVEAKISKCKNGFALDSYVVLCEDQQAQLTNKKGEALKQTLLNHLTPPISIPNQIIRQQSRRQKQINLKPKISFIKDHYKSRTELHLVMIDKSGLLATISNIFTALDIEIHNARISTSSEHVEDSFHISYQGKPLSEALEHQLTKALISSLAPHSKNHH